MPLRHVILLACGLASGCATGPDIAPDHPANAAAPSATLPSVGGPLRDAPTTSSDDPGVDGPEPVDDHAHEGHSMPMTTPAPSPHAGHGSP